MQLNITAYSTALFSTWYFIEDYDLLFDAGDGLTAGLMLKVRKIKNVFISHAHRDHVVGLLQLSQLNGGGGRPHVHFPKDCGSFPALGAFTKNFDPHTEQATWIPIDDKQDIFINKNIVIKSIQNGHIQTENGEIKSLSFMLQSVKRKLKSEFINLPKAEIAKLGKKLGGNAITNEIRENILGYSADTPVEDYSRWDNTDTLIHEATFLKKEEGQNIGTKSHEHSFLPEVLEMAANININRLILGHISTRYKPAEIDAEIIRLCKYYDIKIPVFRLLPGMLSVNILKGNPIY